MIVEGLVTTTDAEGRMHVAPMGPVVDAGFRTLLLRPFPGSQTYRNLAARAAGVFHITDNAALIARASVCKLGEAPASRPAEGVEGFVLCDFCRAYEFTVRNIDTTGERVAIVADVVQVHRGRDFLGFNRAKHAVIEAAIALSRLHILPRGEVEADFRRYRVIVDKTGGGAERDAMAFLERELAGALR